MPARGGGAASRDAARRVAEDLLRLTLDPGPAPRDDSEDAGSGASVVGDARDASPERAVAAPFRARFVAPRHRSFLEDGAGT